MIVHELAHVLGCLFTGVKIHAVKWVGADEAFVQHDKPGAFSGLVISLAPFLLGNGLGFWFLQQALESFGSDFPLAILFLWFGSSMVISGEITLGTFIAFTQYQLLFFNPILQLVIAYDQYQMAMAATERMFDVIDTAHLLIWLVSPYSSFFGKDFPD